MICLKILETADADIQNKIDGADKTAAERRIAEFESSKQFLTQRLDGIFNSNAKDEAIIEEKNRDLYPDMLNHKFADALKTLSGEYEKEYGIKLPTDLRNISDIAHILHNPGVLQQPMTQILTDFSNRRDSTDRFKSTPDEKHRLRVYSGIIDGFERFKALKDAEDFSSAAAGFVDGWINDAAEYVELGEQSQVDWQQTLDDSVLNCQVNLETESLKIQEKQLKGLTI